MVESLLIKNAIVMTMDPAHRVLETGFIRIETDKISAIDSMTKLGKSNSDKVIDAKGKLVMPGLINVHTHADAVLLRGGLSQERSLYDWMLNVLYPAQRCYTIEDTRIGEILFIDEAIRSGITTIVNNEGGQMHEFHETRLDVLEKSGMRVMYGRMFNDLTYPIFVDHYKILEAKSPNVRHIEDYMVEDTRSALNSVEDLIKKYNTEDNLVHVWPSPHGPAWCSKEGLIESLELARKYDTEISIHLAETDLEFKHFSMSSTEYLDSIKFLDPRLVAAHCVWVNDRDIRLLKQKNVKVAHQPTSNMYLSSGFAPIPKMLAEGITIGLGSDDPNCNDSVSIMNEMRAAALIHKANSLDPTSITAEQVTKMATIEGAKAIGMDKYIGSLEVGKKADIIILDLKAPHLTPIHHLPSVLVYQARGTEIDTVIVNGRILMENRKLTWMSEDDENRLLDQAQEASIAVKERAHLELPGSYLITG